MPHYFSKIDVYLTKQKRNFSSASRPVSAYALFFRDTQAAIKSQNSNASFGEVSKIVASMWDALDTEHKDVSITTHAYAGQRETLFRGCTLIHSLTKGIHEFFFFRVHPTLQPTCTSLEALNIQARHCAVSLKTPASPLISDEHNKSITGECGWR